MRARWPIDRPIHALALAVEPNGLGARAKLKPSALWSSALRPPVTGRTILSRTFPFDIVASLQICVKTAAIGIDWKLQSGGKVTNSGLHLKQQQCCYPFWLCIDCEKVWFF